MLELPCYGSVAQNHSSVSIIAVHGLQGHAISTWLHPATTTMWLQDLLPTALPVSRIMSYGYDAKIYKSKSALHIMNKAEDLLYAIQASRKDPCVLQFSTYVYALADLAIAQKSPYRFYWPWHGRITHQKGIFLLRILFGGSRKR